MGVPNSEVGYNSAMPRRDEHEVHKRTCGGIGGKKLCYYRIWCVSLGCWWSAVRCRAAGYASGMKKAARAASLVPDAYPAALLKSNNSPHPGRLACCPAHDHRPPATKALHTLCGNNTSIVSSSWWWAYKCPKHVEQIIIAIIQYHLVCFLLYAYTVTVLLTRSQISEISIWIANLLLSY